MKIVCRHFRERCIRLIHMMAVILIFSLPMANASAQPPDSADFSGFITKFNRSFKGIGPPVYFLPPPPSENELLSRQYLEQQPETITIPKMLFKTTVLEELKSTGAPTVDVARYTGSEQSIEGWMLMEIQFAHLAGQLDRLAEIQNLLAGEYFRLGAIEHAFEFFENARRTLTEQENTAGIMAVNYNLATLFEYTESLIRAQELFERVLAHARKQRNLEQQADVMRRLALIKAKMGRYHEAEQEIITVVVPLFRQLRNTRGDQGRILSYRTLSDIYRLQNRYPEAQWFLLQAREIAIEKQLSQYMPAIIFNLAEVKKLAGNREVAVDEYKLAEQLIGGRTDLLVMRLAIQDALGDIYHEEGRFREALEALSRSDSLREQLNSTDFLF